MDAIHDEITEGVEEGVADVVREGKCRACGGVRDLHEAPRAPAVRDIDAIRDAARDAMRDAGRGPCAVPGQPVPFQGTSYRLPRRNR